ncbi:acyl-CoA dehydrogenase family protein [Streptomyces bottropensis]|uniref:acyl-CoA dehydrogenase family protein n=1 Tax=Streptomyces bottropensis TaxID=42235 RepID=UPI0036783ED3
MEQNCAPRPTRRLIADLEGLLGDPLAPSGPFSFAETVAHEERDALPPGAVEALHEWGLTSCLVPQSVGGRLLSGEAAQALIRSVARRNLTMAVKYGSSWLGTGPVWLWGTPAQTKLVAEGVLAGDAACFGVSEADVGSDLMATATTARLDGDHYIVDGEKWPVGNATQGRFVTLLVRGPSGPVVLLADKEDLPPGSWTPKPAVRTVGMRGHDLSGIALHGTPVPADAVIGQPGRGVRDMLRCMQITRTMIGGISMGAMDAALRIGLDYAHQRELYGRPILRIPVVREHLVGAHLDLLVAECTAIPAARAFSVVPARMALWSSVVKYLVPVIGEEVLEHVAKVLGARSYLRELVASGAFQKIRRDHPITTIFEGTTHVMLHLIATQLTTLAKVYDSPAPGSEQVLSELFDLSREAPLWVPDGDELGLTTRGQDEITRSWRGALTELAGHAATRCTPQQAADLAEVTAALDRRRSALYDGLSERGVDARSVIGSRAAAEHCVHHAAASCVQVWLHNQQAEPDIGWLILVLRRLLQRLDPAVLLDEQEHHLPRFEAVIERCRAEGRYFSLDAVLE